MPSLPENKDHQKKSNINIQGKSAEALNPTAKATYLMSEAITASYGNYIDRKTSRVRIR